VSPVNSLKWSTSSPRDLPRPGRDAVADLQLGHRLAERVPAGLVRGRAARVDAGDRRQHLGRALHRGALHVVQHRPQAAELLAAARAAGAAVHQVRERRAVAGRLLRRRRVEHEDAAVVRGRTQHDLPDEPEVGADDRGDQAALAAGQQVHDLPAPVVRQQRADRAERLDVVRRRPRGSRAHEDRRHEGARPLGCRSGRTTCPPAASRCTASRTASRCCVVTSAPMRVAGRAGRPTTTASSFARSASSTSATCSRGTNAPADRGALLPRLAGHLAHDLAHEQVELLRAGLAVRPSTQAFSESCSALKRTLAATTAGCVRSVRAVAAEPVKLSRS
jgi:hypothetical protein